MKKTLAASFGLLAAGVVAAGLLRGPLAAPASPGLPASVPLLKDDGVVTAQNLVSLSYYVFGGKNHTESFLLKPSGAARWDVMDYYASARYQCADSKISAAKLAEILQVATAVHFPTLKPPEGPGPMAVDGGEYDITMVYRDRAGHRREYHARSDGNHPAVSDLYSALCWMPHEMLKPCRKPQ